MAFHMLLIEMQFPWKQHICQGGSIAKNVFTDSLSVCAKLRDGNKKCTIQPKSGAMPPDYSKRTSNETSKKKNHHKR